MSEIAKNALGILHEFSAITREIIQVQKLFKNININFRLLRQKKNLLTI